MVLFLVANTDYSHRPDEYASPERIFARGPWLAEKLAYARRLAIERLGRPKLVAGLDDRIDDIVALVIRPGMRFQSVIFGRGTVLLPSHSNETKRVHNRMSKSLLMSLGP